MIFVGDDWAVAAADISTGRFELIACGPGELAGELARLSPAETIADGAIPGIGTSAGKGGFDSIAGERALKSRFGLETLDGLGAPSRAELAAAGGLLFYLDATQKGAGILLDAPRRIARSSHVAIDTATRDSLELCRSASGSGPSSSPVSAARSAMGTWKVRNAPSGGRPVSSRSCRSGRSSSSSCALWSSR